VERSLRGVRPKQNARVHARPLSAFTQNRTKEICLSRLCTNSLEVALRTTNCASVDKAMDLQANDVPD